MSVMADEFPGFDTGDKIRAAITSLPATGGIVDASRIRKIIMPNHPEAFDIGSTIIVDRPVRLLLGAVNYTTSSDPVFEVSSNFSVIGIARKTTSLLAKNDGKLFKLINTWAENGTGSPYFSIERMTLIGNGVSSVFDTNSDVNFNFNEGLIRIEDNIIKNFGSVALKFGKSVYYNMICNNYFDDNYGSVYLEYGCDSHILNNRFLQGHAATDGPQIVIVAPNVRVCSNDFFGSDNSSQPDILLKPTGLSTDGGWVWIVDNKFGAERETFNPNRYRIAATNISQDYLEHVIPYVPDFIPPRPVCGPTVIRSNNFLGPGVLNILYLRRWMGTSTMVVRPRHGIPVQTEPKQASFKIFDCIPSSFAGTFIVTAENQMTLTYPQQADDEESQCKVGEVNFGNGNTLDLLSVSRLNNFVTVVTKFPHEIPVSTTIDNVEISEVNQSSFNDTFNKVVAINENVLGYEQKGFNRESFCSIGIAVLTNGNAIWLDYNIDRWDINQNAFYHYGILIDDGIVDPTTIQIGPSLFNDNRIIPPPRVIHSIFKNGGLQFKSIRGPGYEIG